MIHAQVRLEKQNKLSYIPPSPQKIKFNIWKEIYYKHAIHFQTTFFLKIIINIIILKKNRYIKTWLKCFFLHNLMHAKLSVLRRVSNKAQQGSQS